MNRIRKLSVLLIIFMVLSSITGCQSTTGDQTSVTTTSSTATTEPASASGKLFDEPVKLTLMMAEHPTYPYDPDNYLAKKIKELFNVELEVTSIQDGYYDKINLDMASGDMADLIYQSDYNQVMRGGQQGAYVNFIEYLDKMPNFKKWAEENKDYLSYFYSANGELFHMPGLGYGEAGNRTFWLYREDIFEKLNLEIPETADEVYEVSKVLKAAYPDSYPVSNRGFLGIFYRLGVQWDTGYPMYYNNGKSKWIYGPAEDNFKEMLMWHNKMYKEDLLPANNLTLDTMGWQDLVSTNRAFMTSDYVARIDFFNTPMREQNPEFSLQFMPPFKGGENGLRQHCTNTSLLITGLSLSSTSDKIEEAIKYLDNWYTEDAINFYSWGVEGESYEVRDGKKYHIGITDGYLQTIQKYGFFQRGFSLVMDPWAMISSYSPDTMRALEEVPKYDHPYKAPFVPFTASAQEQRNILEVNLNSFMEENVSMFFLGQRPFSEWDDFVKQLEDQGMNDLVELYNSSYQEFLDKLN